MEHLKYSFQLPFIFSVKNKLIFNNKTYITNYNILWTKLTQWFGNEVLIISPRSVIFGFAETKADRQIINHILIIFKYYIFKARENEKLKGCLYEECYGITNGTGQYTRWWAHCQFFLKAMMRLYEAGMLFILSQWGRIPFETDGIPAKARQKSPYQCFVPGWIWR